MDYYVEPIARLISELSSCLAAQKHAQRLAFILLICQGNRLINWPVLLLR